MRKIMHVLSKDPLIRTPINLDHKKGKYFGKTSTFQESNRILKIFLKNVERYLIYNTSII